MSDQADVTGRDTYLLVEALTFTVEAPSGLPIELRPGHNIADMKRLVEEFSPGPNGGRNIPRRLGRPPS
jgi:hypothetical protein